MAEPHLPYVLSQEADTDLESIFDYTADAFGVEQAVAYVNGFEEVFMHLSANPQLGRERNEIRQGLRSFVKEGHVVFYRVLEHRIRVVRILHASRDVVRAISPKE